MHLQRPLLARRIFLTAFVFVVFLCQNVHAAAAPEEILKGDKEASKEKAATGRRRSGWTAGDKVPVECLNRTVDTGEHITNAAGEFQFVPFWVCNETSRPLELVFGSEAEINCTIASVTDPLFHILEFYVHNDVPLSCRLPSTPAPSSAADYTHLQFALTGAWQNIHIHLNPSLNLIVHTTSSRSPSSPSSSSSSSAEYRVSEGKILAATAYSLPPTSASPQLIIGDPLPLSFDVRWYSSGTLPPSTSKIVPSGLGGHVHLSTAVYCLLSFGAGTAVSLAYWRGVELPRRMRRYGSEKLGVMGGGWGGEGTGMGRGGYAYVGKRD